MKTSKVIYLFLSGRITGLPASDIGRVGSIEGPRNHTRGMAPSSTPSLPSWSSPCCFSCSCSSPSCSSSSSRAVGTASSDDDGEGTGEDDLLLLLLLPILYRAVTMSSLAAAFCFPLPLYLANREDLTLPLALPSTSKIDLIIPLPSPTIFDQSPAIKKIKPISVCITDSNINKTYSTTSNINKI